jgi:prolyl-tRNA editing enzyme YbaK/EbsC (Cys-tRNA(Pro) deacylase)
MTTNTTSSLADRLAALEQRLAKLEQQAAALADPAAASHCAATDTADASPVQRRLASSLVHDAGYRAPFLFRRVASDYYSWPLERRRAALGADSVQRLCKTMVLENTRAADAIVPAGAASDDPCATRYYLVVTQYCRRFHADKLKSALHKLFAERGKPMAKQYFNLRVSGKGGELTGFEHNAVTPVGSAARLSVVLSHHLMALPEHGGLLGTAASPGGEDDGGAAGAGAYFWMGGGEVDLKLRVSAAEFARAYGATVLDCTYDEILTPGEEGGD